MKSRCCAALVFLSVLACVTGCRSAHPQMPVKEASQTEWVDPNKLQPGPIQHEHLTADQMRRLKILQQTFRDVDPSSFEKWVEDFKRDHNPEREIHDYEGMAEAYRAYCSGKNLSLAAKEDVYRIVLLRSGAPDSEVLPRLKLKTLSVEDAKAVLKRYKMAPHPIEVYTAPEGK